MKEFLCNLDWDAFWLNVLVSSIFFLISIPFAIKIIPYFTISQLKKKNKKYIIRKVSTVIQEICEYLNSSPFKDDKLNQYQVSISTRKNDLKNYRFVGLINIDVFDKSSYPKIKLLVMEYFNKLDHDSAYELLKKERSRIGEFCLKLETIIDIHSLHIDDKTISEISDICLDIRSFELRFKYNYGVDDLIKSEKIERMGVFGIPELAELYKKILILLKNLLSKKNFETEIERKTNQI